MINSHLHEKQLTPQCRCAVCDKDCLKEYHLYRNQTDSQFLNQWLQCQTMQILYHLKRQGETIQNLGFIGFYYLLP